MNLVAKRYWFFALSLIVLVPGIVSLMIPPALQPGIEFSGGATLQIEFLQPVSEDSIRLEMVALGHPEVVIQRLGDSTYFIRTTTLEETKRDSQGNVLLPSERETIEDALEANLGPIDKGRVEFSSVAPVVAQETVRNAIIAVVVASIAVLLYITWAFRRVPSPLRYGVCAIVALVHDVLIVLGIFSLLGKVIGLEVNAMFITGVLAVIGYSVNDTIVVFDRIRENVARAPESDLANTVNVSLLESLGRSLNTSLTSLLVVLALLLLGGDTVRELLLVFLVGIIVGTYSSVGIASQLLVVWEKRELRSLLRRLRPSLAR